jgi:predicted DNA-binding transcriptional regulator AlpA
MSTTATKEKIVRKREAMARLGVGHSHFEANFAHRLTKVQLGDRAIGFTESSLDRLIEKLIADSADKPAFVPPPNKRRAERSNNKKQVEATV